MRLGEGEYVNSRDGIAECHLMTEMESENGMLEIE